ncbi:MAG: putative zinc-binding metallopeptidase [Pseudohongiellaceae bacterium]
MKNYQCICGQAVFFENSHCMACSRRLAWYPPTARLLSLESVDVQAGTATGAADGQIYRLCRNDVQHNVCNWLISDEKANYCISCNLNQTIPNLRAPDRRLWWHSMENAKRRLLYTLISLGLPVVSKTENPATGLAFEFIEDKRSNPKVALEFVSTGHKNGLITVNVTEADHVRREITRQSLGESYRTLLGHFRHESGHYYFPRLLNTHERVVAFRELFGDESRDYTAALESYHANREILPWPPDMISHYAQAHPLEDWAECWAHYLHMVDTLETARGFGFGSGSMGGANEDIDPMLAQWGELTVMLNALNRSMGMADAYPFILSAVSIRKLRFVHSLVCPR